MSTNSSAAPATPARAAPADAAPAASPPCTRAPRAASLAVSGPNAPLQYTTTYFDLRVWPGYAAAVGLSEPPVIEDKRMYETMHFTKTRPPSKDEKTVEEPKKEKKEKEKRVVEAPNWKIPVKWRKAPTRGMVDYRPLTKREKKMAHKFAAAYDLHRAKQRDLHRVKAHVLRLKRADKAAAALAATKAARADSIPRTPATTPTITTTTTTTTLAMPGALSEPTDMQIDSEDDDASPSLTVALFRFAVEVVSVLVKRKRVDAEDDAESRDQKRRRVETNAPSPSRAADRPIAGKPARNTSTGATASTHNTPTATAAPSAARKTMKLKATLSKCPPPPPMALKKPNFEPAHESTAAQPPSTPRPHTPHVWSFHSTTPFALESRAVHRAGTPVPEQRPSRATVTPANSGASAPDPSRAVDEEVGFDARFAALVKRLQERPAEEVVKPDDARDVHSLLFQSQRAFFLPPRWKVEEERKAKKARKAEKSKTGRGSRGGRKSKKSGGKKDKVKARPDRDGRVEEVGAASSSISA